MTLYTDKLHKVNILCIIYILWLYVFFISTVTDSYFNISEVVIMLEKKRKFYHTQVVNLFFKYYTSQL